MAIMKKLFYALAILAGLSATASNSAEYDFLLSVFQEKQYKKIDISKVSKEAMAKIQKSYGNYTIKEAYRADDGDYKLVLTKDGTELTAIFTAAGDLIKIIN